MSKSELRGNRSSARDSYHSPCDVDGKLSKTIKSNQYDPAIDEDYESGPSRAHTQKTKPRYMRTHRMVRYSMVHRLIESYKGVDWGIACAEIVEKCKGDLQKQAMKKVLYDQKSDKDERWLRLYVAADGKTYSDSTLRGNSYFVDDDNVIQVVQNKPKPQETGPLSKKLNVLKDPTAELSYFVHDKGLWYVCSAQALTSEVYKATTAYFSDVSLMEQPTSWYDGNLKKWIVLVAKKSANKKEIAKAVSLQEKVKQSLAKN